MGQKLAAAANAEELIQRGSSRARDKDFHATELKRIIALIKKLLNKIEDAVPLINLAITASGASLSSTLPSTVSPSRLLQASTFLTAGDTQYAMSPTQRVQIGPAFTLSLYMLFAGHLRPESEEDVRQTTWKEVIHKAEVKLVRVPLDALYDPPGGRSPDLQLHSIGTEVPSDRDASAASGSGAETSAKIMGGEARADEFAYQLVIVENLEDDRVHTFEENEEQPGPCEDVGLAGVRESIPIHEISKIFYADTGKILNIGSDGETNNPILLLKRDVNAVPPRRIIERYDEEHSLPAGSPNASRGLSDSLAQNETSAPLDERHEGVTLGSTDRWRLPAGLDLEWMAMEVFTESEDSETESDYEAATDLPPKPSRTSSLDPSLASSLSNLKLASPASTTVSTHQGNHLSAAPIRTSLSLLETLLRLLSLQQFQQAPHLSIPDELLTFFLSESASTGSDGEDRKRLRNEARQRVGFDPYDESPIKRHGEEYQYQNGHAEDENENSYWTEYDNSPSLSGGRGVPLRYGHSGDLPSPSPRRQSSPRSSSRSSSPAADKPQTPPQLLRKGHQPPRNGSPLKWINGRREDPPALRSSPLVRPPTGMTDEGIGTSPASADPERDKP